MAKLGGLTNVNKLSWAQVAHMDSHNQLTWLVVAAHLASGTVLGDVRLCAWAGNECSVQLA